MYFVLVCWKLCCKSERSEAEYLRLSHALNCIINYIDVHIYATAKSTKRCISTYTYTHPHTEENQEEKTEKQKKLLKKKQIKKNIIRKKNAPSFYYYLISGIIYLHLLSSAFWLWSLWVVGFDSFTGVLRPPFADAGYDRAFISMKSR